MTRDRALGGQPQLGLDHPGALAKLALRRLVRRRLDLLLEPGQLLAERAQPPHPAVDDDRLQREVAQEAHPVLVVLGDPLLDRLDRRILPGAVPRRLELAELPVQAADLGEDVLDPPQLALRELGSVERLQVLIGLDLVLPQLLGQVHELAPDHRDRHDRPADPLLAALDLLSEPHLLLGVQEVDAADLTQIEADGILGAGLSSAGSSSSSVARSSSSWGAAQGVLGLARGGQVEPMEDLLHLVRGDELPGRLAQPLLGLGLSNSGHGHRGVTVLHGTTLEHRSPSSGSRYGLVSRPTPTMRRTRYPESFHGAHLFRFFASSFM